MSSEKELDPVNKGVIGSNFVFLIQCYPSCNISFINWKCNYVTHAVAIFSLSINEDVV